MKKINLIIPFLITLLLFIGCGKKMVVNVTSEPVGGYNVNTVACSFEACKKYNTKPEVLTIEWYWKSSSSDFGESISENTKIISSTSPAEFITWYSASSGYYLTGYFYVVFTWNTFDGYTDSEEAFCY